MKRVETTGVAMEREQRLLLDALAAREQTSRSWLVRRAIAEYLRKISAGGRTRHTRSRGTLLEVDGG